MKIRQKSFTCSSMFLGCMLLEKSLWAMLPLSFTSIPTIQPIPSGQMQELKYVIRNNVRTQALPIKVSIVNDGDNQPQSTIKQTNDCGAFLAPNASCTIWVTLNGVKTGSINKHLSIDYQGRTPLTSPIKMAIKPANTTVLVYMVGSDLERKYGFGTFNIQQMQSIGSTANMSVVLETGGANKDGWREVKRQLVKEGYSVVLENLGKINMGATATIQDFITWGVTNFPAQKYILVFWDHGGGPNGGFGADENFNDTTTPINQIVAAVQGSVNTTGTKFEIIGFDTCLLGVAELASGLSPFSKYLVGSEDLEPGAGWQYSTFLNYVTSNLSANGLDIGTIIVNGFSVQNAGKTTTLSVLDLSNIPSLLMAVNHFSNNLISYATNATNWKIIASSRFKSADYSTSVWDNDATDVVDMISLANNIGRNVPELVPSAEEVISATQSVVKYFLNSSNRGSSLGLATYFPSIMSAYKSNYGNNVSLNNTFFYSENYVNFLNSYNNFYKNNTSSLTATFSNFMFNGTEYTASLSNDFSQLYAAVGSNNCTLFDNTDDQNEFTSSCLSTLQFSGINAQNAGGSTWNIQYDKNANLTWPSINGEPAMLLDSDVDPQIQTEQTYLIPVTGGYIQLNLNNNTDAYEVVGFQEHSAFQQSNAAGVTVPKVTPITPGTKYKLRAYAKSTAPNQCYNGSETDTWCLMDTNIEITAPFTITTNTLPSNNLYNKFSFLVGDLTGQLNLTPFLDY